MRKFKAAVIHATLGVACMTLSVMLASCSDATTPDADIVERSWNLGDRAAHWVTGFADHTVEKQEDWQLAAYLRQLPVPFDTLQLSLYFRGRNHSDDLFMYFARRLDGLVAGVTYDVDFDIELASNAATGCPGAGGSPGDAQWLKVGAINFEPRLQIESNYYRLNADIGDQADDGRDAIVIGTIGVVTACQEGEFRIKRLQTSTKRPSVTADQSGGVWIIAGVDSGYEGLMQVYFTSLRVTLRPR